jgi:hypothetical protein
MLQLVIALSKIKKETYLKSAYKVVTYRKD